MSHSYLKNMRWSEYLTANRQHLDGVIVQVEAELDSLVKGDLWLSELKKISFHARM